MKMNTMGIPVLLLVLLICCCAVSGAEAPAPSAGALSDVSFRLVSMSEGFSVPVPEGDAFLFSSENPRNARCVHQDADAAFALSLDYKIFDPLPEFMEDADAAASLYAQGAFNLGFGGLMSPRQETVLVDGHPASLTVAGAPALSGDFALGAIFYARNNQVLRIRLAIQPSRGSWENLVTLADMRALAKQIAYDPSLASMTTADGAVTLSAKGDAAFLSGGKKLQFSAAFANPGKVNRKAKNNALEWSVTDAETGAPAADMTIDRNGLLSVSRKLSEVRQVVVSASSPVFHTHGSLPLTVLPAVTGISAEPKELVFYSGETRQETVRVSLLPENVPPLGLTWQARQEGVVEIAAAEDGTAAVTPLRAGRTWITVREPGGKTAKLSVNVLVPVESLTLSVRGRPRPGAAVTCSAVLQPRNAGKKDLTWSVDVGEDIASINARGQLRLSKTASAGTVITVTCEAPGAPEPVRATVQVTVE